MGQRQQCLILWLILSFRINLQLCLSDHPRNSRGESIWSRHIRQPWEPTRLFPLQHRVPDQWSLSVTRASSMWLPQMSVAHPSWSLPSSETQALAAMLTLQQEISSSMRYCYSKSSGRSIYYVEEIICPTISNIYLSFVQKYFENFHYSNTVLIYLCSLTYTHY